MTCVWILGSGALGSFVALRMKRAGEDVHLLAREPRLSQIRADGLILEEEGGGEVRVDLPVHAACSTMPPPDFIWLCTKTTDLPTMLDRAGHGDLATNPVFVTVQNGVGAADLVSRHFPDAPVIATRAHGFFELDDGRVRHVGVKPSFAFGAASPRTTERHVDAFAQALATAGIEGMRSHDIRRELWEKLMLTSPVGGTGAAFGINAGEIWTDPTARDVLEGAMREVVALALRRGVALPDGCVGKCLDFVRTFPPEATTSLQRDLRAGRPSEYDDLCGAVIAMAREEGLAVPFHRRIDEGIRARGLRTV